jgi:hypothetical protein
MSQITLERIKRLKEHIARTSIKHEEEILKESTLKDAHIYCVINDVSSQQYGPLIEKYILFKNKFVKNNASDCKGDCSNNNKNAEIKASLGGAKHNKFNWVQMRVSHNIHSYILTAYHLDEKNAETGGELYTFNVPKDEISSLILRFGGYAHGTNKEHGEITLDDLNSVKNMKEYALRPIYGGKCWQEMLRFRCETITI